MPVEKVSLTALKADLLPGMMVPELSCQRDDWSWPKWYQKVTPMTKAHRFGAACLQRDRSG
ncbi:MAG: hypothetical protein ACR2PL_10910, partial [Dehalococcoidia bacterium]